MKQGRSTRSVEHRQVRATASVATYLGARFLKRNEKKGKKKEAPLIADKSTILTA